MGFFSKVWKGIKGAVKKVAKGVKKVAKGIVTSIPGGQKLWKEGGRLGKKVMKGIGKVAGKLGPVGMMALSFVLAPVMAPALSSMWAGFGAGAASMAGSANALVAALGNVGSGIFAAGNFIGGTIGAMGEALTQGASNVMQGNFSGALKAFSSNMGSALSGEAGMATVNSMAAQAANTAGTLLGQSVPIDPTANLMQDASVTAVQSGVDPALAAGHQPLNFDMTQGVAPDFTGATVNPYSLESSAQLATTGKVGDLSLTEQSALIRHGTEGVQAIQPSATQVSGGTQESLKRAYDAGKSLLGGGNTGVVPFETEGVQAPVVPGAITSAKVGNGTTTGGGVGSAGFSLLSGVRGLEQSIRNSQSLMFS